MENQTSRQLPIQISQEEIEIINDIRKIDFGRITICVQNGVIVTKEVTTIVKNNKNKNNGSGCVVARRVEQMSVLVMMSFLPLWGVLNAGRLF